MPLLIIGVSWFDWSSAYYITDNLPVNDVLIYLPQDQTNASVQLYSMGTTAFAFISLRPDAFRLNSASGGIPTRAARTFRFDVWGYIGNASLSELNDVRMCKLTAIDTH